MADDLEHPDLPPSLLSALRAQPDGTLWALQHPVGSERVRSLRAVLEALGREGATPAEVVAIVEAAEVELVRRNNEGR